MRSSFAVSLLAGVALAARPFLNEADTGLARFVGVEDVEGVCPELEDLHAVPDFDFAARNCLNASAYSWFRHGVSAEWSYRNNLESFHKLRFRPRNLVDVSNTKNTLRSKILGHEFAAPFFIAPAAGGINANNDTMELSLMTGAAAQDILYIPALFASKSVEELAAAKAPNQTVFWQLYVNANETNTRSNIARIEAAGARALIFTIDAVADGSRVRDSRYRDRSADAASEVQPVTWDYYTQNLTQWTTLPVILKGITTVKDAQKAVEVGAAAIYLSNHGGRQLDGSPSPLETAIEIFEQAPEVFDKIEVWADSGVRYGVDILKLMALGVKAVGLGRSFHYGNVYGQPGVEKVSQILKDELALDAANLGVQRLSEIGPEFLNLEKLRGNGW